ncbi:MAG: serine/threonine-protein phosphatase [Salinivirgaceae bacterium]|nr:serine/threonine-protein phosphatase [Salinivirgaceae bacterium]
MNFFRNHQCNEPAALLEIKKQELSIENIINIYRAFIITFLIITDFVVMHLFGKLDNWHIFIGLPGIIFLYFVLYRLHIVTKRDKPKPALKYLTIVMDYLMVFGGFYEGKEIMLSTTDLTIQQYLLFASIFFIIINTTSALRIQWKVIAFATFFGILLNTIIHASNGSSILIIIYTGIFILISGFFNKYLSSFIFQFYVTNYKLSKTLGDLQDAHEEIKSQNDELATQNDYLAKQRDEISEQKKQITSSIEYASRIQGVVLASSDEINQVAPDSFIFFKPKDIVSGDFYWFRKVEVFTKKYHVFTAVDCTGHGVPGAFMSMLGTSFLNEIIAEFYDELNASQILNRLREEVKIHLHQNTGKGLVKDGMDMALCAIDYEEMKLQFAGANNPLYIIRNVNGLLANEIEEIKPDKMPIGVYIREKESFTNHTIEINKGDLLYVFSDGFVDQFGGEKNEKFKKKRFKELLLSVVHLPMLEQKEILENTLKNWMDDTYDQIDDITVIGVRV